MKNAMKIFMAFIVITTAISNASAKVLFSDKVGGTGGINFMLPAERFDILSTESITRIAIQHGRRIEQIEIEYANARDNRQVESAGNDAGEWSFIDLEEGEFITYITGRAGTLIDQITFHTSLRRTFGPYGGNGGQDFEISIPSNAKVIGFTGNVGPSINQIGLIYRTYDRGNNEPTDPRDPNGQGGFDQEAPDVFENSPQGPIIQTAPIPPSKMIKQTRDHRTENGQSSIIRDSIRVTKYTPSGKDFDIRQIIIMNGRGNQEQLTKGTSTIPKRKIRDHRNNAGVSLFHPDSARVVRDHRMQAESEATMQESSTRIQMSKNSGFIPVLKEGNVRSDSEKKTQEGSATSIAYRKRNRNPNAGK